MQRSVNVQVQIRPRLVEMGECCVHIPPQEGAPPRLSFPPDTLRQHVAELQDSIWETWAGLPIRVQTINYLRNSAEL